jgi:hypothetical protein
LGTSRRSHRKPASPLVTTAASEHPAVSPLAPDKRGVSRHAIADVGMGLENPDRLSLMIVLEGPSGIDGKHGACLCPLLHSAFPPAGVDQHGFNRVALVGIDRLQKLIGDPSERIVGRPSVGVFGSPIPGGDRATPIPGENHVMREVEQARLRRETFRRSLVLQREQRRDGDSRQAYERAQRRRGDGVQVVRKQISGYCEDGATRGGHDDVAASRCPCRDQNGDNIQDGDGPFQRREEVDEKNREGENG